MKILLFTDNHFCENYSILRKYGTKYSLRLENQLQSLNWLEKLAIEKNCDEVICLGDFFDRSELNEQEITALKDIEWNNLPHYFIVGNHESSTNDLQYNSTKALESDKRFIISETKKEQIGNCELCFLPYIIESDRKPLHEYFGEKENVKRVILSHNDLKGIQMGPVISKSGFDLNDIKNNCDLFLNGHLHNGQKIAEGVINLGNFTGKDFGEDATKYQHSAFILDTETLALETIENPFAFNFYKLEINSKADIKKLDNLKNNAILSIKCKEAFMSSVKEKLGELTTTGKVLESRIIATRDLIADEKTEVDISELTMDHLAKFVECCMEKITNTVVLENELSEVCK